MGKEHVVLIGPMGAGKTAIGRALARLMRLGFFDSDEEIVRRTGVDISLIFELEGEAGFRRREHDILKVLCGCERAVIATGGGAILSEGNRKLIRNGNTVVYLHASVDAQVARTGRRKHRPLLAGGNAGERLAALFAEREPVYRSLAHIIVNTDRRDVRSVAREIYQKLQETGFPA